MLRIEPFVTWGLVSRSLNHRTIFPGLWVHLVVCNCGGYSYTLSEEVPQTEQIIICQCVSLRSYVIGGKGFVILFLVQVWGAFPSTGVQLDLRAMLRLLF